VCLDAYNFIQLIKAWKDLGATHSIGAPIHIYPLFENGFRAHRGQTIAHNHEESAQLYAEFSKVAEGQEYAWNYGRASTKEDIGTVTKRNRMICFPCEQPPSNLLESVLTLSIRSTTNERL
jgi:hypothetical protein